ncbi:MAG: hypothetical protein ACN6NK_00755, partial [Acinetobacter pseudolwoffii]
IFNGLTIHFITPKNSYFGDALFSLLWLAKSCWPQSLLNYPLFSIRKGNPVTPNPLIQSTVVISN